MGRVEEGAWLREVGIVWMDTPDGSEGRKLTWAKRLLAIWLPFTAMLVMVLGLLR
jgi:hypothetical protein